MYPKNSIETWHYANHLHLRDTKAREDDVTSHYLIIQIMACNNLNL